MKHDDNARVGTGALALAALGVVYGDIGTSPLYAFKEAFIGHGFAPTPENVLATLSALFWAVMLIISFKYVWVILKFDNDGEGGVLALTALARRLARSSAARTALVVALGVFGAALFYGDAIITPAISVISAVEGVSVAMPRFEHWVIPITIAILIGLFAIQRHGTGRVGGLFGPVTIAWFLVLAALGAASIAQTPQVLAALDPRHAIELAADHPAAAFLLLSAVFLALTGGEALYADMGHFGARPVRLAWYGLVWPALMLNYFGQGALVIRDPAAVMNPFYLIAPEALRIPLVILATAATIIASQATISGAYSVTLQASRLGYLPRIRILHTSDTERGQIYISSVNWLMLIAVIVLVLQFRSSSGLAAAYGIAVSGTMIITTALCAFVTLMLPGRVRIGLLAALALFALLEAVFFASNLTKLAAGGWLPMALGAGIFIMLTTWKEGTGRIAAGRRRTDIPIADFLSAPPVDAARVPGTGVYLTSDPDLVPSALFHNLKHFKVLHETIVFLHVVTEEVPQIPPEHRVQVKPLAPGMYAVALRFGFREEADICAQLDAITGAGVPVDPMSASFFVARTMIVDGPGELPRWRCALFSWMTRQAESAATYYNLPANRVVEVGTQVVL
ncbi:MAG: potassium transporter Kup [Gammaproteobacteria bacterium]